jgi:hypothetical protein
LLLQWASLSDRLESTQNLGQARNRWALPGAIGELEQQVPLRRTWKFATGEDQWQRDTMHALVLSVANSVVRVWHPDAVGGCELAVGGARVEVEILEV